MDEAQRNGTLDITFLMREVHVHWSKAIDLNGNLEVWQFVDLALVLTPVKLVAPMGDETLAILAEFT